jgi:hypothetical protein
MRLLEEEAFRMETKELIALQVAPKLALELETENLDPSQHVDLARKLCSSLLSMPSDEPEALTVFQQRNGRPGRVVSINISNGIALLCSAIGAVAGGGAPIGVVCAVLAAVFTIGGVTQRPTKAEGAALWALYGHGGRARPEVLRAYFEVVAQEMPDVDVQLFNTAIHSLEARGLVERENGEIVLIEEVEYFWT